jgi:hypothetical protein
MVQGCSPCSPACFWCLLVRRETDRPLAGLLAISWFGVTAIYQQAVTWFAASFSVLTLVTCRAPRRTAAAAEAQPRRPGAVRRVVCPGAAWFASGVLAGPICGVTC